MRTEEQGEEDDTPNSTPCKMNDRGADSTREVGNAQYQMGVRGINDRLGTHELVAAQLDSTDDPKKRSPY